MTDLLESIKKDLQDLAQENRESMTQILTEITQVKIDNAVQTEHIRQNRESLGRTEKRLDSLELPRKSLGLILKIVAGVSTIAGLIFAVQRIL